MDTNDSQLYFTFFKNIESFYENDDLTDIKKNIFQRFRRPSSVSSFEKFKIRTIPDTTCTNVENVNESFAYVKQSNRKSIKADQSKMSLDQNDNTTCNDGQSLGINSNKYNISNFFKHIYSLKSINVSIQPFQSSSNLNQSNASLINAENNQNTNASKQFWMPDEQVKECFQCSQKFTTIRRRHHCRVCGQIFCSKCSEHEIPSKIIWPNTNGNIRACTFCYSFVAEIQKSGNADFRQNSTSVKELMKRLSLPSSYFNSTFSNADQEQSQSASTDSSNVQFSIGNSYSSTASISTLPINSTEMMSDKSEDLSNPFDVNENKEELNKTQSNESEIKQLILNNSSELRSLWVQLYHTSDGIQFTTKSINKFRKVHNSISGRELVDWLIKKKSVSKDQAIVIGQALMHGKWLECSYQQNPNQSNYYLNPSATNNAHLVNKFEQVFYDDNTFYKPGASALNYNREDENKIEGEEEPEWIKEINKTLSPSHDEDESTSSSSSQINLKEAAIASAINDQDEPFIPFVKIESKACTINDADLLTPNIQSNSSPSDNSIMNDKKKKSYRSLNTVNDNLQKVHKHLQTEILKQMLKLKNVSFEWFDIILDLATQCVDLVKPDVKHDNDSMDIRAYIKIKKLMCGNKNDSRIVNGLVFTKNLAHKSMDKDKKSPKILLLKSSIEYNNRTEDKMCSLESIYAAESQYLKNNCSKLLLRYKPDVLVVEKSVARVAQEIFLLSDVSLALNVKSNIMEKLVRFLQADPMYSIDDPIRKPKLGFCSRFHVQSYHLVNSRFKSLMFFEGTPTNLGCTLLLHGQNELELKNVKAVLNFMIFVIYNSKLEQSFILDKFADFNLQNTIFEFMIGEDELDMKNDLLETSSSIDQQKQIQNQQTHDQEDDDELVFKLDKSLDSKNSNKNTSNNQLMSIDQNPLETSIQASNDADNNSLKLIICDQHNEKTNGNLNRNFKLLIDDLHLSCSPFIKYKMPYLLLDDTNDPLRTYLPSNYMNYLDSFILQLECQYMTNNSMVTSSNRSSNILNKNDENNEFKAHQFLSMHLTKSFDDKQIQRLYADFKSRGGITTNVLGNQRRLILKDIESSELSNESSQTKKIKFDCLDIFNRQHLAVLYVNQCDTSPIHPNICQKPRVIDMKFYSENDMTLGSFLAKNCFRIDYKCTNELCSVPIVFHTRSFVHADTKITIRISIIPNNSQNKEQHEQNQTHTFSSPLNPNTTSTTNTNSSANSNSTVFSNSSPNNNININNMSIGGTKSASQSMSVLSVSSLLSKSPSQSSNQSIHQQQTQSQQVSLVNDQIQNNQFVDGVYDDINIFMWSVCKMCNKSTKKIAMSPDSWSFSLAKFLELTFHSQSAYHQFNPDQTESQCTHSLFDHSYQYFRYKNIVTVFSTSKIIIKKLFLPDTQIKRLEHAKKRHEYIDQIKYIYEKALGQSTILIERLNQLKTHNLSDKQMQKLDQYLVQINNDISVKSKIEKINLILTNNLQQTTNVKTIDLNEINYALVDLLMIDLKKYMVNFTSYWNNKVIELFSNKKTKSDEEIKSTQSFNESIDSSQSTRQISSNDQLIECGSLLSESPVIDNEENLTKTSQSSQSAIAIGKRLIASFIASSTFQPLKTPFAEDEHYILSSESSYYVNEKYLSSIVAFALCSREYIEYQQNISKIDIQKLYNSMNQNQQMDIDELDSSASFPNSKSNLIHFELQFSDSNSNFYCKAYHSELFCRLRKLIMPNEEDKYINSLFRCVNWEAKGGKSNSQFRKTLDNRFILKEMSRQEVASFVDFAPQYINYLIDSIENKKPTVMAKIFGAYKICMKNSAISSSKATKIDIIVMENLFVANKFKNIQIFDLKGSERNRLINVNQSVSQTFTNQSSDKDVVLLDENFLRWSFDNPIYIKPHSKFVLMKAIENDCKFLSSKYIMDYSLLCGIDTENSQVKVGLIDYLRAFTWDKKVETYIKKTIGGSQGKMPTIVSPEVYKTRFVNAIERYFQQVPDQWYEDKLSS